MRSSTGSTHVRDLHVYETNKKKAFNDRFEVIKTIGKGSMGAICMVQKREEAIGGSAFKENQMYKFGALYFKKSIIAPFKGKKDKKDENAISSSIRFSKSNIPESERRSTEVVYALKSIQLNLVGDKSMLRELKNEIEIMKSMDHPNIAKAYEIYYHGDSNIYIVMECCSGGDLYKRAPYPEGSAARYGKELLRAIKYMHEHGIVHRDLKFENIMFESNHEAASIKVIDFGLAKKFASDQSHEKTIMTNFCGSLYTMAPQVIMQIYTAKADLWSAGVIIYMMLSDKKPFQKKRRKELVKQILAGRYFSINGDSDRQSYNEAWEGISEDAKDLVRKLLIVDQDQRMDAAEALDHPWFQTLKQNPEPEKPLDQNTIPKPNPYAMRQVSENTHQKVGESLVQFRNSSKLKRIALNLIAYHSSSNEIMKLRRVFKEYDTSHNGVITYDEFQEAVTEHSTLSEDQLREIFDTIDVNENGHIMYTEFLAATLEANGQIEEERIAEAFDRLDGDNTGDISTAELETILGKDNFTKKEIKEIMKEVDKNNDGKISYAEFLQLFRKNRSQQVLEIGNDDDMTSAEDSN